MSEGEAQAERLRWWAIKTTGQRYTLITPCWHLNRWPEHARNLRWRIWIWYLGKRGY